MQNWQDRQLAEGEEFITHPYLSLTQAPEYLKISKVKLSNMARAAAMPYTRSQSDSRFKLCKKADFDAWLAKAPNTAP